MGARRRPRRTAAVTFGVALVIGLVGFAAAPSTTSSGAIFNDVQGATAAFVADTLQPPTGFGATGGGASATLTWTPTGDAYAAGYRVERATSSGGTYALVGTTTPASAGGYVDSPATDGTYWYRAQTFVLSWLSSVAGPASATVSVGDTGYHACSAQAADTGGDGNGYQGTPANACANDGAVATDTNSGRGTSTLCTSPAKDRHRFSSFGLGVPLTATAITGVSVDYELGIDSISGTNLVCAQLSWDGGTTWTAMKSKPVTATALTGYTLGGTTDTWGRTWLPAQLSDTTFRVRLINVSSSAVRDYRLDGVEVRVNYTP
jgi:hypothetical protein